VTIDLKIRGVGVWTPGHPDASTWSQRQVTPGAEAPRAELLPPMLRRRTSLLTRMAAEVAEQAIKAGELDARAVPVIYGSVYGEIRTTVDILAGMLDPAAPMSPTKFHNSVHNTAAGYVSIASQNRSGNAALTAGAATVAMGVLECAGLVAQTGAPALLVIAEEALPEPLAAGRTYGPLAAAFALAPGHMSGRTCRLEQGEAAAVALPAALAANPCAPALALVDALLAATATTVGLGPGWRLALEAG
jgi:hypothetical protein